MSEYKVVGGVPVPPKTTADNFGTHRKYPWPEMDVGTSFEMPIEDPVKRKKYVGTLTTLGNAYAKSHKLPWRFTSRATETGVRVWRIK